MILQVSINALYTMPWHLLAWIPEFNLLSTRNINPFIKQLYPVATLQYFCLEYNYKSCWMRQMNYCTCQNLLIYFHMYLLRHYHYLVTIEQFSIEDFLWPVVSLAYFTEIEHGSFGTLNALIWDSSYEFPTFYIYFYILSMF